jgi:hypothetical protein
VAVLYSKPAKAGLRTVSRDITLARLSEAAASHIKRSIISVTQTSSPFSSSVVLFNAAFLCYKQICYWFRSLLSRPSGLSFAYEKFGVIFNSSRPFPPGKVTGLPVRVRRDSRLQLASEKQGKSRSHVHSSEMRKGESACSYGRAVAKIVCANFRTTL